MLPDMFLRYLTIKHGVAKNRCVTLLHPESLVKKWSAMFYATSIFGFPIENAEIFSAVRAYAAIKQLFQYLLCCVSKQARNDSATMPSGHR
ncbi:MAG: hypothetical protein ACI83P_000367 [Janthinobacterium sp.]|jgi:hypothetical protein